MYPDTVSQWLDYIGQLSNTHLDFTTSFAQAEHVLANLQLNQPAPYIIVVTGTNGKGSVVAALEQLALSQNFRVGATASPHVEAFNERIRLHGQPISDDLLCEAFAKVAQNQGPYALNYFQFSFLAALVAFSQADLDLAVLEVGVGGRLDACNLLDHQQTIITNVALDHCDKLGYTREAIAHEKADLIRTQSSVIFGEQSMPQPAYDIANQRQACIYQIGRDFSYQHSQTCWQWWNHYVKTQSLAISPHLWCEHAAIALQSWYLFDSNSIAYLPSAVFQNVYLKGRQELIRAYQHQWLLDVAHNPQAVSALKTEIDRLRPYYSGQIVAAVAMRSDKAVQPCLNQLSWVVDQWYAVDGESIGLAPATVMAKYIHNSGQPCSIIDNVEQVVDELNQQTNENDLIVIFGSFILVGIVRQRL